MIAGDRPRAWDALVAWVRARDAARGQKTPAAALAAPKATDEPPPTPAEQLRLI